jgi:hypothetical protein
MAHQQHLDSTFIKLPGAIGKICMLDVPYSTLH